MKKYILYFFLCGLLSIAFAQAATSSKKAAQKPKPNQTVSVASVGGKRIALVIGNGKYQHADTLPTLANPTHDAEDIAAALT